MGHNLEQLGTATLDTMGGLITFCDPQDLPEGASPRCFDVDFIVGSVFTRPGLSSVYTYATTPDITALTLYNDIGTFTYTGKEPTVNEGFTLGGFSGQLAFLNGTTVYVTSATISTFTANINTSVTGTFTGLTATAVSTVGQFVGPNAPTQATVVDVGGNAWNSPNNILGDTGYATVSTSSSGTTTQVPGTATTNGWANPLNALTTGSSYATVTATNGSASPALVLSGMTFNIPSNAEITGVAVTVKAFASVVGVGSINLQLADNGDGIGSGVHIPLSTSASPYTAGSSQYQWGTTLTPDVVNGNAFNVIIGAACTAGSCTVSLNSASVSVSYSTAEGSEELQTFVFNFSIPSTSGISGFGVAFQAYTTDSSSVVLQLLKNGIAVGTPKTQALTTTPTVYSVGGANDLWDSTWLYSDVNNTEWGVQVTATGNGTTGINDLDALVYVTPALVNFNYVKTYKQDDGQITTIALDASGLIWEEDVTNSPGTLSLSLSGIIPGSYAKSATQDDQEYICFSDLSVGTDRPRVLGPDSQGQLQFLPLSQIGPGAPPIFQASLGSGGGTDNLTITDYSVSGGVVTFTFTTATTPVVGALYTIKGTGVSTIDGYTFVVLGTPAPSTTQFSAPALNVVGSGSGLSGTAYPTYSYPITSITQPAKAAYGSPATGFNGQILLWSSGPGQTTPGTVLTFYYGAANAAENAALISAFASGDAVYVYISKAPIGNGTWQVTSHGIGIPPSETLKVPYFTVGYTSSSYQRYGGPGGTGPNGPGNAGDWQLTKATVTTTLPIPDLTTGDQITITGAMPSAWNNSWTILDSLKSGVLNITSSQMDSSGNATYGYNVQSGVGPVVGQIVAVSNCTNAAVFNTTGVISAVSGGGTFTISGFPAGTAIAQAFEATAQAITYGTQFTFDPGATLAGTTATSPIYGNTSSTPGTIAVVGGSVQPIGAGTRQGVVFFITESGYWTQPSTPVTFTVSSDANYILASNIPLGPPNVVGRGIAFTEAGQNGVPGANFYVIENPVVQSSGTSTTTYTSTIINDNVSTSAKFTFVDSVLLNSTEIDIQGQDLFNLIELGSSAWCVPYANRMFYGLQLNKINNWTTGGGLTFDSGYLPNQGGNVTPLGWSQFPTANEISLITSQVTGMAYYVSNTTGSTQAQMGMISQTAYQDAFQVPIIRNNTAYSVRVAASCPSGKTTGTLVIDLVDYNAGIGFGTVYGSFTVPFSSIGTTTSVFSGTLLTDVFTTGVSPNLNLRVWIKNMGNGADCEIDRIEVYPTLQPYLLAQVYGSYINDLESIDASGTGGIIDTSSENSQACMGAFVMRDVFYFLKTNSMYSVEDNPNTEPGGWSLREVSNKVGTIGIHSYDSGEEWMVTACRQGIYGFNGGQPQKISLELWNLWELINWDAGNTIVLRNDIVNKRILCAVPLPTGTNPFTGVGLPSTQWLPYASYNPNPTSPNVILMLNYQGMSDFNELVASPEVHTTMFGTLAAVDMKRKWSIWQVATPYMDFILQQNGENAPLYVCNGIGSSKIYQFLNGQLSDDGVAINSLYTTYGFVNATKAATLPIFGFHAKRYTVLQVTASGAGTAGIRILPNVINPQFPYTVPVGLPLTDPAQDDYFRPVNVKGNRAFLEISTDAVGAYFKMSKVLLTGKADPWSSLNPVGGGNVGISTVQGNG